ncbi:MAG TPA: type II toxin-antitoxin system prevent-host-death family antitoxin [Smithellaceae bacterium]|jgi:hypothetical protein|nr:type II toxin-antitoxin system prevent-host-death family antitoxin [Smithellaceae bacterium]HOU55568.1 type II toxin-antitoxin system prevent-host-death family antitoxin [Smithellaceae bacterium]HPL32121.1 type II toxin-antitoxin system prevent-host-death family antitoxin [Smithellaceae bacterium]HQG99647.1 type II toxin-antitoxin system prevent-host-death family antitoxin [Smithellaceae bacterium]HQJ77444.1 type II toxin-antitoxin system prevent-host-death family antitoxin [Smithellaceae ba
MKVYTYSEARQRFAEILNIAREEDVIIQRRGGEVFTIAFKKISRSPFAIPGIKTKATTKDILQAIKDSRERNAEPTNPERLEVEHATEE